MKTGLSSLLLLLLPLIIIAQQKDVEVKQLGKFGPMEISYRVESDLGKESKGIIGSYTNAGSDDIADIGGVFFSDSASVISFASDLSDAVDALDRRKGKSSWVARTYQVNALRDVRRVRVSGVGRNSSAYTDLTAIQAQRLSEALKRSAHLLGD